MIKLNTAPKVPYDTVYIHSNISGKEYEFGYDIGMLFDRILDIFGTKTGSVILYIDNNHEEILSDECPYSTSVKWWVL